MFRGLRSSAKEKRVELLSHTVKGISWETTIKNILLKEVGKETIVIDEEINALLATIKNK